MSTAQLLIEVGTEELPPKSLLRLSEAFASDLVDGLREAGLVTESSEPEVFATPRRIAVKVDDVAMRQADRAIEKRGPAVAAAFDDDGSPTRAAQGFAGSCGVSVDELERLHTDKGEWLVYRSHASGSAAAQLLPDIVREALHKLPVAKRMRWADLDDEFVRPVHWLVAIHGKQLVDMQQLSVISGTETRGHRFHHPGNLRLASASDYPAILQDQGQVIASFGERRERVREQVERLAQQAGGIAYIEDALLDEVTALVEWPVAQLGNFNQRYLEVPAEALISAMQDHQKYFPVKDQAGQLLPYFIFVANIDSSNPASVQAGNERVLNARFADARFFWDSDRKIPLLDRTEALRNVVFHKRLGSLHDRVQRIARLASNITAALGGNTAKSERSALLAKSDLLSGMVFEFPDLQGIMGRYYAIAQGEDNEVADAIREQYLPRYAGDDLPATMTGQALSIADKLDNLVGIFSIGETPTGDKDPFALRRAAIGVLRIIIEMSLDLDLQPLLLEAARSYGLEESAANQLAETVLGFMLERLQSYYADQGYKAAHINSVLQRRPSRPLDFDARLTAVRNFSKLPEADSLSAANKRIRNILRKSAQHDTAQVDTSLLSEPAEQALHRHMQQLAEEVEPLFASGDYSRALSRLASLRPVVDDFFDNVMVNVDDAQLRNNRLALLDTLGALFLRTADLSLLQG